MLVTRILSTRRQQLGETETDDECHRSAVQLPARSAAVRRIANSAAADLAFYRNEARAIRRQIAKMKFGDARVALLGIARKYEKLAGLAEDFIRNNPWLTKTAPRAPAKKAPKRLLIADTETAMPVAIEADD
jgi:hypothetical protein